MQTDTTTPTDNQGPARPPAPVTAALLSVVLPGLGQLHCGRLVRCLAFMAASAAATIAFYSILAFGGDAGAGAGAPATPRDAFWSELGPVAAGLGVFAAVTVWAVADAVRLASAIRRGAAARGPVFPATAYVLLLVIGGLASSVLLALQVRRDLVAVYRVPNASMAPAVGSGSRVVASLARYRNRPAMAGEIAIFANPGRPAQHWIKRVVATAGQSVEVRDGRLWLDGAAVTSESPGEAATIGGAHGHYYAEAGYQVFIADGFEGSQGPVTVPENHVFVLGDNRSNSKDSRHLGAVPWAALRGRATFVF